MAPVFFRTVGFTFWNWLMLLEGWVVKGEVFCFHPLILKVDDDPTFDASLPETNSEFTPENGWLE